MKLYDKPRFGVDFARSVGWIAEPDGGPFKHTIWDSSWNTFDSQYPGHPPSVLLCLDLLDSRLSELQRPGLVELPLCSHVHPAIHAERQEYVIDVATRSVSTTRVDLVSIDEGLNEPVPTGKETRVSLRAMVASELPTDETQYWAACDSFVGGGSFIRVLGPPVWMQWVENEVCNCGEQMSYVASIGYESSNGNSLIPQQPFFLGEFALYFLWCRKCIRVVVLTQDV